MRRADKLRQERLSDGHAELIAEISHSTESIDLNAKKVDYENAGVLEYVVVALQTEKVVWFKRKHGKLKETRPDGDDIYRSEVFPGLWLDPAALLRRDGPGVLAVVHRGLTCRNTRSLWPSWRARKVRDILQAMRSHYPSVDV